MLLVQVPTEAELAVRCLADEKPLTRLRGVQLVQPLLVEFERRAVADARAAGLKWAQIGRALGGITAQSAQARFGPYVRPE
jgi:hypothetical protein